MDALASICSLTECSYNVEGGSVSCGPGGDSCTLAYLQTADVSAFHDSPIKDVTAIINEKLDKLAKKPPSPGLQLSFLWTPRGVMLAWVNHDEAIQLDGVTRESGLEENDKALGIQPNPYIQDAETGA